MKNFFIFSFLSVFMFGNVLCETDVLSELQSLNNGSLDKTNVSAAEMQQIIALVDKEIPKDGILLSIGKETASVIKDIGELAASGVLAAGATALIMSLYVDKRFNQRNLLQQFQDAFRGDDAHKGDQALVGGIMIGCFVVSWGFFFLLIKAGEKSLCSSKSKEELRQELMLKLLQQGMN